MISAPNAAEFRRNENVRFPSRKSKACGETGRDRERLCGRGYTALRLKHQAASQEEIS